MKQYSFLMESVTKDSKLLKLNSISNIKERIDYCNKNFKFIDNGVGKRVYLYNKNSVLKLAYNRNGLLQNHTESLLQKYNFDFLAKTLDYGDKYRWVLSEYCYCTFGDRARKGDNKKQFNQKIKKITGLLPAELWLLCKICIETGLDSYNKTIHDYKKVISDICEKRFIIDKFDAKTIKKIIYDYNFKEHIKNLSYRDIIIFLTPIIYCNFKIKSGRKIDYKTVFNYIDTEKYRKIEFITSIMNNDKALKSIEFDDCFNSHNTGICNRNGKDTLVIIDYGWKHK